MDYKKLYSQLIERAQIENRQKGCGVYFESHHIVHYNQNRLEI